MASTIRLSLANKCQLLFGIAVILILTAALSVLWFRMDELVRQQQQGTAHNLAQAWFSDMIQPGEALLSLDELAYNDPETQGICMTVIEQEDFEFASSQDTFLAQAIQRFQESPTAREYAVWAKSELGRRTFQYAMAIHKEDLARLKGGAGAGFSPTLTAPQIINPLKMILFIQLPTKVAQRQLLINRVHLIVAGLLAVLLAIGTFYYITKRLILSPVRVLIDTAEQVAQGDLNIRADINTGDEFQHLSDVFNEMLSNLKKNEDQLRGINKSLDLKLGQLAETNVALYEANKIKGEFLANVSHELRTPLNSIAGFAEVLHATFKQQDDPSDVKRKRYTDNIIQSSRHLLDLINDLLDLAKIEAGRMDLRIEQMSVKDTAEGLVNLIKLQADKKQVTLTAKVAKSIPLIETDPGKVQQIIFNFLSNAVKFTPTGGTVTLTAKILPPATSNGRELLRLSVIDTGPGIAKDQQHKIFDKFTQLDATVTREHAGTGLGLTISRELAQLLQGKIELESDINCGATFSLLIPLTVEKKSIALMPNLTDNASGSLLS